MPMGDETCPGWGGALCDDGGGREGGGFGECHWGLRWMGREVGGGRWYCGDDEFGGLRDGIA